MEENIVIKIKMKKKKNLERTKQYLDSLSLKIFPTEILEMERNSGRCKKSRQPEKKKRRKNRVEFFSVEERKKKVQ